MGARLTSVKPIIFLSLFQFSALLSGQITTPDAWANLLKSGHERLAVASSDWERLAIHDSLLNWWSAALDQGLGQSPALKLLEGRLAMPEAGRGEEWVRVISWNVELSDRTQRYGGFILAANGRGGYETTVLEHDLKSGGWTNMGRPSAEHWPGAIYYSVVLTRTKQQPHYTLLGWDGADALVTRKVIEPLDVKRGRVRLGDRTIIGPDGVVNRYVLEYADDAVVALRFEPEAERIVMDHLSPTASHLKGSSAFYGPDMTYDALVWKKGNWLYLPDVDVADPNMRAPYIAPPNARRRRG